MYDWEDKDGRGKLNRIFNMLQDAGYSPKMSENKIFVTLFHPNTKKFVVRAYAPSWHDVGLIFIQTNHGVHEVGFTSSVDKAYKMLVETYKSLI